MHPHVHMRMCPVWVVRTWSEMHLVVPRVGHMFTPLTHASPATHELSGMASGPEMRIRVAHMSPTHKPHATPAGLSRFREIREDSIERPGRLDLSATRTARLNGFILFVASPSLRL
jgi:hypothetical protein